MTYIDRSTVSDRVQSHSDKQLPVPVRSLPSRCSVDCSSRIYIISAEHMLNRRYFRPYLFRIFMHAYHPQSTGTDD